jgi:transposase
VYKLGNKYISETVYYYYVLKDLGSKEVAKIFKVHNSTILYWLKRWKIKIKPKGFNYKK